MTSVPDPKTWATGDDKITDRQKAFIETLSSSTGEEVDTNISKGEASRKIDELKNKGFNNQQPAETTSSAAAKPLQDPKQWTTGDEPHTERQERFLKVLERDAGEKVGVERLTKSEASQRIEELKEKTGRS
ncbi:hypothetical protein HK097_010400 [Rhizophlyctis rosea]|uniref:DUF3072 domain-containing protein n=1 Tax=Rhizophlyctis rosea TaxID=64517 RepID=A0AAD5S7M2_9FUNG|nr:hypothetical protein HK097_010400 [Rhizophlyctis rosea]